MNTKQFKRMLAGSFIGVLSVLGASSVAGAQDRWRDRQSQQQPRQAPVQQPRQAAQQPSAGAWQRQQQAQASQQQRQAEQARASQQRQWDQQRVAPQQQQRQWDQQRAAQQQTQRADLQRQQQWQQQQQTRQWQQDQQRQAYARQEQDRRLQAQREDQIRRQNSRVYSYGNGYINPGYGHYRIYRNGGYYVTDYNGISMLQQGVNYGYQEGVQAGLADRQSGRYYDFQDAAAFQSGLYGYNAGYVDSSQYGYYFREGFRRGYDDGYYGRYQYGTYSNGTFSILSSILAQVLSYQGY